MWFFKKKSQEPRSHIYLRKPWGGYDQHCPWCMAIEQKPRQIGRNVVSSVCHRCSGAYSTLPACAVECDDCHGECFVLGVGNREVPCERCERRGYSFGRRDTGPA